jgi:hypothetical protein
VVRAGGLVEWLGILRRTATAHFNSAETSIRMAEDAHIVFFAVEKGANADLAKHKGKARITSNSFYH